MAVKSGFVVSRNWLKDRLGKPGIAIVDASWYLPAAGRDGQEEYNAAHIPGAVFSIRMKLRTSNPACRIPCHLLSFCASRRRHGHNRQ